MKAIIAVVIFIFTCQVVAMQSQKLWISSDEWCPFVCDDKDTPGFLVEIMREISDNSDIKLKFSLLPLTRALNQVNKGLLDAVLALTSQHIVDNNLQRSGLTFGSLYNDFYVRSHEQWHYQDIDSLTDLLQKDKILGIINGYEYGPVLDPIIAKYKNNIFVANGETPLANLLKMLDRGRIDIILDSRYTVQYERAKLVESNIVRAGTQGSFTPLYLGYSAALDVKMINIVDSGLVELRRSGRLRIILAKYGLEDWMSDSNGC